MGRWMRLARSALAVSWPLARTAHRATSSRAPGRYHPTRYDGASNKEDDVAVISRRCRLVRDDAGDAATPASARPLALPGSFSGIIGFNGDRDVFSVQVPRANARLELALALVTDYEGAVAQPRSNLDAGVQLLNAQGSVVQEWGNDAGLLTGNLRTEPLNLVS